MALRPARRRTAPLWAHLAAAAALAALVVGGGLGLIPGGMPLVEPHVSTAAIGVSTPVALTATAGPLVGQQLGQLGPPPRPPWVLAAVAAAAVAVALALGVVQVAGARLVYYRRLPTAEADGDAP